MRALSVQATLAAAILAILGAGCASTTAPPGFLPTAQDSQRVGRGGWITASFGIGAEEFGVDGELVAVDKDSLYVLSDGGLDAVALSSIRKAKLMSYRSGSGEPALWTLLGTLSTASHGVGLIITAPVWILVGSSIAAGQSHAPELKRPEHAWAELRAFARFPQGLPHDLDRDSLSLH